MSLRERAKAVFKEGEVYRQQGLFEQAKQRYLQILETAKKDEQLAGDTAFIATVKEKVSVVENTLNSIDQEGTMPTLSEDVQDLIADLFGSSKNKDIAAIDGAVALVKFGQYERALIEFKKLLNKGVFPMMVAKNMLRCHLSLASAKEAIDQFNRWFSQNVFSRTELKHLRDFLEAMIAKEGTATALPPLMEVNLEDDENREKAEDIFEISNVRIQFEKGPLKGQKIDLNVAYQAGNNLSFVVNADDKRLVRLFRPGIRMPRIQCYSPISLFNTRGFISDKRMIGYGPKCGDYLFDMKIEGLVMGA